MPAGATGAYSFKVRGKDLKLIFKPEFLTRHRGFFYYNPREHKLWQKPVAGWCSWAAHFDKLTEEDMAAAADMVAEKLLPYGCDIIQMDDGYQYIDQYNPDNWPKDLPPAQGWTRTNERFPSGLRWLRDYIKDKGLTPGIWMSSFLPPLEPEDWFVKKDGELFRGKWVNCAIDGAIPEAVEYCFRKTFKEFKEQGWEYFKVDTIRHVLYDNYRLCPEYFASKNEVMEESFRGIYKGIKDEIGPDIFMLSCWGAIPEMAGFADGCRIGEDVGPRWDSVLRSAKFTCQFAWMNNIVWRNDPDYMCLRLPVEAGRTWASYIGLSGVMTMVSDPADSYDDERLDIFRRVIPPLFIRPTTLEPVYTIPTLWALEINRGFESWMVLGRFAWNEDGLPAEDIPFAEIGLDPSNKYFVFDFWNERFIGSFKDSFISEKLDNGHCRIYAIRKKLDHPQVLSTSRHITQGGYELEDVRWDGETLWGKLKVVANDPVRLYIYVPEGYDVESASADYEVRGEVLQLSVSSMVTGEAEWQVAFHHIHR
jgi:hypothetical protein